VCSVDAGEQKSIRPSHSFQCSPPKTILRDRKSRAGGGASARRLPTNARWPSCHLVIVSLWRGRPNRSAGPTIELPPRDLNFAPKVSNALSRHPSTAVASAGRRPNSARTGSRKQFHPPPKKITARSSSG
jgi:hypothetical protein